MSLTPNTQPAALVITQASDFPTLGQVQAGLTTAIIVNVAGVTDNDPAKTNTGQTFPNGAYIIWNGTNWTDIQTGGVVGPASSTVNAIAKYSSTDGTQIANSGVLIDSSNNVSGINNLTQSGNQTFSSTGQRILADMSNATRANRFAFQTSTTNGNTRVGILPNGISTLSGVDCYAGTDPDNTSFLQVHADGSSQHVGLNSTKAGTGTTRNLVFQIDSVTKAYLDVLTFAFNLSGRLEPSSNTESLSATKTLTSTSPQYQFLNPNGSNRDVTLPSATTNMLFFIKNTGSAGNTLTVKDSGGTPITGGTIANTVTMGFYYNGTSWQLV